MSRPGEARTKASSVEWSRAKNEDREDAGQGRAPNAVMKIRKPSKSNVLLLVSG